MWRGRGLLRLPGLADHGRCAGRNAADDARDRRDVQLVGECSCSFDERMEVVTARMELECDVREMPDIAEIVEREVRRGVLIACELPEQSEASLECGFGTGHPGAGKGRGDQARVRRPARMQRLHR